MKNFKDVITVETKDLSVGYGDKTVLKNLNIRFKKGEFVSFLGPNGAGKTTLLRTLSRHLRPICGSIFISKKDLKCFKQQELAKIMSVVLTERVSPPLFNVFELVALGRYPHTGITGRLSSYDEKVVEDSLKAVHAMDLAYREIGTLSDGERQKVLIARALAQEPEVILLDEPTIHLDLKHRMEVMSILKNLCRERGITVVASMHDVDLASKISDSVALVKDSTIIDWGPAEQILKEETVANLYDFDGVSFNSALGSIEIKANGGRGPVFVAGGIGCATVFYRLLAKHGFAITTGVIHENDLDCYVAKSLGAKCVTLPPMEKITQEQIDKVLPLVKQAECVIDSGFPVAGLNRMNTELITYALAQSKPVFTLRKTEDTGRFLQTDSKNLFACENEIMLLDRLEMHLENKKDEIYE